MISVKGLTECTERLKKVLKELQDAVQSLVGVVITGATITGGTITNAVISGGTAAVKAVCTVYAASGAITLSEGVAVITATSAVNLTVAAPTTAQNGTIITVISATDYAHTITFTGSTFLNGTSAAKTTATFAAYKGATLRFIAYEGHWYQSGLTAATLS